MKSKGLYHYYVEGADDEKIVNTLKTDLQEIIPGKVEVFNAVQDKLTKNRMMTLKPRTTVILVFDVDAGNVDTLMQNLDFLHTQKALVKEVLCVTQVMNLEEELVRSCRISSVQELTKSRSKKDYKHDLVRITNLDRRLRECGFDIVKFWARQPDNQYKDIKNDAGKIKLCAK